VNSLREEGEELRRTSLKEIDSDEGHFVGNSPWMMMMTCRETRDADVEFNAAGNREGRL
jgi:hypothetical protein